MGTFRSFTSERAVPGTTPDGCLLFVDRSHHEDETMNLTTENWRGLVEEALGELPEHLRERLALQRRLTGRATHLDIVCCDEGAKTIGIDIWNDWHEWVNARSANAKAAPPPDGAADRPFISIVVSGDRLVSCFPVDQTSAIDFKSSLQQVVCETLYKVGALCMDEHGSFYWQEPHYVQVASGKVAQRNATPVDDEASARRHMADRFGVCPKCGKNDGYVRLGRAHWCICVDCCTKWPISDSLLSYGRDESQGVANAERIAGFEHVRPAAAAGTDPIPF